MPSDDTLPGLEFLKEIEAKDVIEGKHSETLLLASLVNAVNQLSRQLDGLVRKTEGE